MGLLAGTTAAIYRYTKDGRRVYAYGLIRTRQYLVPDEAVPMLERRLRQYHLAFMGFLVVVSFVAARLNASLLWIVAAGGPLTLAGRPWLTRGLTRVHAPAEDLQPLDPEAVTYTLARATGPGTLWILLLAAAGMATLGGYVAISESYWVGWVLVAFMLMAGWQLLRQLLSLRRSHSWKNGAASA